jgi:hypothetical protein
MILNGISTCDWELASTFTSGAAPTTIRELVGRAINSTLTGTE